MELSHEKLYLQAVVPLFNKARETCFWISTLVYLTLFFKLKKSEHFCLFGSSTATALFSLICTDYSQLQQRYHYIVHEISSGREEKNMFAELNPHFSQSSIFFFFSFHPSLTKTHTHILWMHQLNCKCLHRLQLSPELHAMNHCHLGRPLHWGGLLHRREALLGLCGHPASCDLQTCKGKQENCVYMSLNHLSSLFTLTRMFSFQKNDVCANSKGIKGDGAICYVYTEMEEKVKTSALKGRTGLKHRWIE